MTRGGGGVQTPPKKDDIICEQPLREDVTTGQNAARGKHSARGHEVAGGQTAAKHISISAAHLYVTSIGKFNFLFVLLYWVGTQKV